MSTGEIELRNTNNEIAWGDVNQITIDDDDGYNLIFVMDDAAAGVLPAQCRSAKFKANTGLSYKNTSGVLTAPNINTYGGVCVDKTRKLVFMSAFNEIHSASYDQDGFFTLKDSNSYILPRLQTFDVDTDLSILLGAGTQVGDSQSGALICWEYTSDGTLTQKNHVKSSVDPLRPFWANKSTKIISVSDQTAGLKTFSYSSAGISTQIDSAVPAGCDFDAAWGIENNGSAKSYVFVLDNGGPCIRRYEIATDGTITDTGIVFTLSGVTSFGARLTGDVSNRLLFMPYVTLSGSIYLLVIKCDLYWQNAIFADLYLMTGSDFALAIEDNFLFTVNANGNELSLFKYKELVERTHDERSSKDRNVFFSYKEATPFVADANCLFSGNGKMSFPSPTILVETDIEKIGSGEHGKKNEIQCAYSEWKYATSRLSEIAYLLSFFLGVNDRVQNPVGNVFVHEIKEGFLSLPTFTFEYFNRNSGGNYIYCGNVITDFELSFGTGSETAISAVFSGVGNRFHVVDGSLVENPKGTMTIGEHDFSSAPILSYRNSNLWIADDLESDFGISSVDFSSEDLGSNVTDVTTLLKNIRITGTNGMSADTMLRAGGNGTLNSSQVGSRRYNLMFDLKKDIDIISTETPRLEDKKYTVEIGLESKEILSGYPYAIDIFLPVVSIMRAPENNESPISKLYQTEVLENFDGDAFILYVQSKFPLSYNAEK